MEKNTFPYISHEISIYDESLIKSFQESLRGKNVIMDIGCGHGDFLIEKTLEYTDCFFIGVEISRKRAYKTSVRLTKRNIKNFALLDSDGELALKLLLPENSINEIHINFPDPWLRKRQWKKRIFKPSFLIQIIRVLKREGTLNLVTDVGEYATEAALLLSGFPQLKNNYDKLIVSNLYRSFPTLFYRKMSPLRDINYLSFKKAL